MDARRIAFDVLLRVERGGAWANVTLDAALRAAPDLDPRDRGLSTELVYGTLRRALALDWALDRYANRPVDALDPKARAVLRLGAYQLLHMRIPDHAAVGETVELAKAVGLGRAAGFVNGVLRNLARHRDRLPIPDLADNPKAHLLATEGLPGWLYDLWHRALPAEELPALAAAVNEPAAVVLRAASPADRDRALEALAAADVPARAAPRSPVGIVLEGGRHPDQLPPEIGARLQPQDEAAQLVTLYALLEGTEPLEIRHVLDPCAAPGGKTCHLAQTAEGVEVVACDLHARRVDRVAREAARLGLGDRIVTHAADATLPLPFARGESQDLVLLDAPCTGLGTLQRHPEIKLRRTGTDVARLADLQRRLLDRAAGYVRPGGRLVYAVCTWTPAEGPDQVEAFLARHPEFRPEPPADPTAHPWGELVDAGGAFTSWPHRHGTDGFYAMRLRREG